MAQFDIFLHVEYSLKALYASWVYGVLEGMV